jgi:hypothetical protein
MTDASIRTVRKSKHWKTRQANARHAVKLSLSIFALLASAVTLAAPAHAQSYPWCAIYSGNNLSHGQRSCALQQNGVLDLRCGSKADMKL